MSNPMYNDPSRESDASYFFTEEELASIRKNKAESREEEAENDTILEEFKEGKRDELGEPVNEESEGGN